MFDDVRRRDVRIDCGTQTETMSTPFTRVNSIPFSIDEKPHLFA